MKESENDLLRRGDVIEYIQSDVQPYTIARVWAIPAVTLPDRVVEPKDVVEGIRFMDHHGCQYEVVGANEFVTVNGMRPIDSTGAEVEIDPQDKLCLPRAIVAAMLNVAEEVTFPEGHRLAPKPEPKPTLLEAVEAFLEVTRQCDLDTSCGASAWCELEKAVEAEKRKVNR